MADNATTLKLKRLLIDIDGSCPDVYNEFVRVHFKPTTTLGKWSAWLIVAFAVFLVAYQAIYF
jgi:hypothetical protein